MSDLKDLLSGLDLSLTDAAVGEFESSATDCSDTSTCQKSSGKAYCTHGQGCNRGTLKADSSTSFGEQQYTPL